jgi:hypothetical protein
VEQPRDDVGLAVDDAMGLASQLLLGGARPRAGVVAIGRRRRAETAAGVQDSFGAGQPDSRRSSMRMLGASVAGRAGVAARLTFCRPAGACWSEAKLAEEIGVWAMVLGSRFGSGAVLAQESV